MAGELPGRRVAWMSGGVVMVCSSRHAGGWGSSALLPLPVLPSLPAMAWSLVLAVVLVVAGLLPRPAAAQIASQAEAARPPVRVAVLVSSRRDVCHDPGDVAAVTSLVNAERERINREGGIHGRPLEVRILDDARNADATVANLRSAIADPATLAVIGLAGSDRAKAALDALGKDLDASRIPVLSSISVNSLFASHPTVFTTQATQDDERLPVMVDFLRHMRFARPAYLGAADTVFSRALGDGLQRSLGEEPLVADHRVPATQQSGLDPAALAAAVADLAGKKPDILVLGVGSARAAAVLAELVKAGVTPALFVSGRIDALPAEAANSYPNALYQLAFDRLPEADNDRLRRRIVRDAPERWVFEGSKIATAPGWAEGKCEERETGGEPDPMTGANMRAIGIGSTVADMLGLAASAARTAKAGSDVATLRQRIVGELRTTYATGRGVYKGAFDNWSFNPGTRAASQTPFVVMLPQGLGRTQLAPVQFVRLRDGSLRRVDTFYLDIDLVRAHRVEDNEKTFFAEFYVALRSAGEATIDQIEFTNAFVDPRTNGRQIGIEALHDGRSNAAYPAGMTIYKVSGRFVFEPELANYPFDTQRFSIDIQPKRGDAPFIVQPPPNTLRDKTVATDGWQPTQQYVGYDEDFVPLIDAYTHQPSVVPFYKASYVWMMKRETTDYYLRVVVPLAFILVVAYLSIFIPISHFEAIVTIQVTALLSAVALYLSLPKIDSDSATVSDRIFVFNYMLVSLMIVISIMRMNGVVAARPWLGGLMWTAHVLATPLMVAAMAWYVYMMSLGAAP